jgi:zinc transporter ZupT
MPGAIALAAVFFLTVIEMTFTPGKSVCSGGHKDIEVVTKETPHEDATHENPAGQQRGRMGPRPPLSTVVEGSSPLRDKGPLFGRSNSFSRTLTRIGEESKELDQIELAQLSQRKKTESDEVLEDSDSSEEPEVLPPDAAHKRAVMQVLLLEMGILFHSVFIGMSLSVSIGSDFIILLIAIVFHRK